MSDRGSGEAQSLRRSPSRPHHRSAAAVDPGAPNRNLRKGNSRLRSAGGSVCGINRCRRAPDDGAGAHGAPIISAEPCGHNQRERAMSQIDLFLGAS